MSKHTLHGKSAVKLENVSVLIKTHVGAYRISWGQWRGWVPKSISKLEYNQDSVDMIVTEWFYNKYIKDSVATDDEI